MKDLYTVSLDEKQVAKACENYVVDRSPDNQLVARAEVPKGHVNVRVSTKRKPKADRAAEAKQAGVRG